MSKQSMLYWIVLVCSQTMHLFQWRYAKQILELQSIFLSICDKHCTCTRGEGCRQQLYQINNPYNGLVPGSILFTVLQFSACDTRKNFLGPFGISRLLLLWCYDHVSDWYDYHWFFFLQIWILQEINVVENDYLIFYCCFLLQIFCSV